MQLTKLQQYLDANGISASAVERASGMARASFRKVRQGRDPRLSTMCRILRAVRNAGQADARMADLFDLEPLAEKDSRT
jgi:predicted transcriptional regulator